MNTVELTAQIVSAQCNAMSMDEIIESIKAIHDALRSLEAPEPELPSAANSIRNNEVICLECGGAFKLLSNKHLGMHGLTPREYKKKHGMALSQPLSAKSLTRKRREAAKAAGMGSKLTEWRAARKLSA